MTEPQPTAVFALYATAEGVVTTNEATENEEQDK